MRGIIICEERKVTRWSKGYYKGEEGERVE